ncbi:MAG: hypothetical protein RL325_1370 [Planctomycetota bacterium]
MSLRTNHSAPRRGLAVVLALVAVSVATLLGLTIATSSDATVATSENLSKASEVRAAAASGVDLAQALLAERTPEQLSESSVLFDGVVLNGASLRAEVRDAETGSRVDGSTTAVEIVVRGQLGDTVQVARAVGRMPLDAGSRADLDCSEFALLGTEAVSVGNGSLVGPWSASPLAALSEPVRFGTAAGTGAGVALSPDAAMHGCVELRRGGFATDREEADELLADKRFAMPAALHVPAAPLPDRPADVAAVPALLLEGTVAQTLASSGDARVPSRGYTNIRGNVRIDVGGNLFVERGARVLVEDAAVIVVRGNAVLEASAIEVAGGGSLALVVVGDLTLDGAYLGGARSNADEGCDASGAAAYDGGASRTVVFGASARRVLITDGSVVKGQVYAPESRIDLENRSAVYGRVLGRAVSLHEGVALFYDPALDRRVGWTNPTSGVWASASTPRPEVLEVDRLDDESLLEFALETGVEPEPASIADAAIVLEDDLSGGDDFNSRINTVRDADRETLRKRVKLRLEQRLNELRELRKSAWSELEELDGARFVTVSSETSKDGDD